MQTPRFETLVCGELLLFFLNFKFKNQKIKKIKIENIGRDPLGFQLRNTSELAPNKNDKNDNENTHTSSVISSSAIGVSYEPLPFTFALDIHSDMRVRVIRSSSNHVSSRGYTVKPYSSFYPLYSIHSLPY